ncbi:hypothetical protein [Streptomyces sp. NPDC050534]|uniref:hypothetical protein n=1 Tax=Streptomyces sp. NPDC050534 TaxID=3365625 RepID=UPI0037B3BB43
MIVATHPVPYTTSDKPAWRACGLSERCQDVTVPDFGAYLEAGIVADLLAQGGVHRRQRYGRLDGRPGTASSEPDLRPPDALGRDRYSASAS